CGQISNDGHSIRIYAGCGIVAGSNPEKELTESNAKFAPMRSALSKISTDSLANLNPHPLYVAFNYTHPPLVQRLKNVG
ncbi:MAG: hypothetical protein EB045_03470, partial [Actinobacteria bacterium]|nr:hypothetical protein [Actinomycetota bacterium]